MNEELINEELMNKELVWYPNKNWNIINWGVLK